MKKVGKIGKPASTILRLTGSKVDVLVLGCNLPYRPLTKCFRSEVDHHARKVICIELFRGGEIIPAFAARSMHYP